MLLRHTTKEIKEREALTINPAKTCQPVGAMYAALGFHSCMPHSHGSQGCCAYHRSMLTRHYKEPVMATTSSFTEGSAVFGGQANLLSAVENIFTLYKVDELGNGVDGDILNTVFQRCPRIAGSDINLLHFGTLRQTPSQCVFAPARTDYQNLHINPKAIVLMSEMSKARKDHGDSEFVRRRYHFIVPN